MALRRRPLDLQLFSFEMSTFLKAGLSVAEALALLINRLRSPTERHFASLLHEKILAGHPLSDSLEKLLGAQADVLVALVRSAEQSGKVPLAFERFAAYRERLLQAQRKIVTALIYPALLVLVGVMVIGFLLLYIVPRFASVYGELERDLPWASHLMVTWGGWVSSHPSTIFTFVGAILILVASLALYPHWRREIVEMGLSIYVVKDIRRDFDLGKFYYTISLLLDTGLPALQAIDLCKDVLGPRYGNAHQLLVEKIQSGQNLSEALKDAGLSTDIAERLLRSGEGSGSMSTMLRHCSTIHEDDTWRFLDRFTRAFEPICTVVLGVIIGGLVVLMYLPIFELSQAID
jgi:general secretion pathway protein F